MSGANAWAYAALSVVSLRDGSDHFVLAVGLRFSQWEVGGSSCRRRSWSRRKAAEVRLKPLRSGWPGRVGPTRAWCSSTRPEGARSPSPASGSRPTWAQYEVGVAHALPVLAGEARVRSQGRAVVEKAGDRTREQLLVFGGEGVLAIDTLDERDRLLPGRHVCGQLKAPRPVAHGRALCVLR